MMRRKKTTRDNNSQLKSSNNDKKKDSSNKKKRNNTNKSQNKPLVKNENLKKNNEKSTNDNNKQNELPKPDVINENIQLSKTANTNKFFSDPIDMNVNIFDELEYHCDCCPIELISYSTANEHYNSFNHDNMSVVNFPIKENIKCYSCDDNSLSKLKIILVDGKKLISCCTACLENANLDHLIYSFSSNETLFKYIDHLYRLSSLKCFNCNTKENLCVDDDLTCYCLSCVDPKTNIVKQSDPLFLSKLFNDEHYNDFQNIIYLQQNENGHDISNNQSSTDLSKKNEEIKQESKVKEDKQQKSLISNAKTNEQSDLKSAQKENKATTTTANDKVLKALDLKMKGESIKKLNLNKNQKQKLQQLFELETSKSKKIDKSNKKENSIINQSQDERRAEKRSFESLERKKKGSSTKDLNLGKNQKSKPEKQVEKSQMKDKNSSASSTKSIEKSSNTSINNNKKEKITNTKPQSEQIAKINPKILQALELRKNNLSIKHLGLKSYQKEKVEKLYKEYKLDMSKTTTKKQTSSKESTPTNKTTTTKVTEPNDFRTEAGIQTKFQILKNTIKKTLPDGVKLKFDNLSEYYNYLTYCLLLEELHAENICSEVEFEWIDETTCNMLGSTKTWFDLYVNADKHHLKKQPFIKNQPIFIFRKSDAQLDWDEIPEFWCAFISSNKLTSNFKSKHGRQLKKPPRRVTTNKSKLESAFFLKLYDWNASKFPVNENGRNFVFLPGGNILGRILNSMKNVENGDFINLILGTKPIKQIKFNNVIKNYHNQLNDSQKEALQSVLNNSITILQGPPGSGKTSTIYEIILKLLSELNYYPILVVAASNLAVDNIAEKLIDKYKDRIVRITSLSKEREYDKNHRLGSVCLHNKVSDILPPNMKEVERNLRRDASSVSFKQFQKYLDTCAKYSEQFVKQANIIFSTTVGIAGPHLKNLKSLPVVIMDEATQSSEPSTLIPLGAKGCKKIVLVGDTAQLSVFTRVKSLEMSLFERVLSNGTYKGNHMLDTQYRMHPDISSYPRRKFYDNKLKDGITEEQRKIPGIKYPVYFFDHQGIGATESKFFSVTGEELGFSWINPKEVQYIETMIVRLMTEKNILPSKIGIMTGYAAQRDLLVKTLEKNEIINPNHLKTTMTVDKEDLSDKKNVTVCTVNGIIIATVDAFQGREMDFVLLSCVRSNENGNIGFMSDKRRMNVALTRAKYSFIICGNANTLSSNILWKEYIEELRSKNYVKENLNDY